MKYEKPEIVTMASAITAIQGTCEKNLTHQDNCGGSFPTTPAYEADE